MEGRGVFEKMGNKMRIDYSKYAVDFTPAKLWEKIAATASKAGYKVVYVALLLYYVAIDSKTPLKDKALIYGTLGYFILPLDLIPDAIPISGYVDDFTALMACYKAIKNNISPEIREKARLKVRRWFRAHDDEFLEDTEKI